MAYQARRIQARDGFELAARVYLPDGPPCAAVLIAGAMGVPQRFYEAFANWLAEQSVAVLTFDLRGIGESAPKKLRGFDASISDWATKDLAHVVAYFHDHWRDVPRSYLGHSLGGQLFGWLEHTERFDHVVTVASGNGYWRLNAPAVRMKAPLLWWLLAPVSVSVAGYFPGKRLGAIGDLPAAAMWQWRRWCLHPDYLGAEGPALRTHYAKVKNRITAVLAEDDELLSPLGIRRLYSLYSNAAVQFEVLNPKQLGLEHVGHFGLFKPQSSEALWPRTLAWLGIVPTGDKT